MEIAPRGQTCALLLLWFPCKRDGTGGAEQMEQTMKTEVCCNVCLALPPCSHSPRFSPTSLHTQPCACFPMGQEGVLCPTSPVVAPEPLLQHSHLVTASPSAKPSCKWWQGVQREKGGGKQPPSSLTLTCLSSAVVSSNSSSSLKLISVFLKVLWVFTVTLSPSTSMMVVGLVRPAICLVAKPTPGGGMGVSTMSPCITPEPLLVFLDFFCVCDFLFLGGRRVPLHPHGAVLWGGGSGNHSDAAPLQLGRMGSTCGHHPSRPLWGCGLILPRDGGFRTADVGTHPLGPPPSALPPHRGCWGGIPPVPPTPNPGSSPSPAQHRVALSYSYFCILLFLFLFSPFKPVQCSSRRSPPSPVKKIK